MLASFIIFENLIKNSEDYCSECVRQVMQDKTNRLKSIGILIAMLPQS